MTRVDQCVICDGQIRVLRKALVAPFLAKRIWDRNAFCVDLVRCLSCGFAFYNPRLDDQDLAKLYAAYHSPEYVAQRRAYEPWYTPKFNANLASAKSYVSRRKDVAAVLKPFIATRTIKQVLDYGGDHGDLVAGLVPGAEGFVYDISGAESAAGVTPVAHPAECTPDLIVNSNVLEHVGFPAKMLAEITAAAPAGALIFLEVPFESPLGFSRLLRRIAQTAIVGLVRPTRVLPLLRPASLYLMHEHINYFTVDALKVLLRRSGCEVLDAGCYFVQNYAGKFGNLWCIAQKSGSGGQTGPDETGARAAGGGG